MLIFWALFFLETGALHYLYKHRNVSVDITRKLLHICGGVMALLIPMFFHSLLIVSLLLLLPLFFLGLTYFAGKLGAIHHTKRFSVGSIIFPVPVFICYWMYTSSGNAMLYYLPIALLTFADPAAQFAGNYRAGKTRLLFNGRKTEAGSTAFFAVSLLCGVFSFMALSRELNVQAIAFIWLIAVIATLTEMISFNGWDNITVPLAAAALIGMII